MPLIICQSPFAIYRCEPHSVEKVIACHANITLLQSPAAPVNHMSACLPYIVLADRVGLPSLALERMLFTLVVLVVHLGPSARGMVLVDMLGMVCHSALIHFLQRLHCQFDVFNKRVASCPRKVFSHHDSHELKFLTMRSHGISRHHPAPLSQMVSNRKFIEVVVVFGIQPKCNKRQTFTPFLAHDQEPEVLEGGSKVVGCTGKVEHDGAIAVLTQTDHLVVLTNHLGGAFGKVEGKRGLVGAKIIDVEY